MVQVIPDKLREAFEKLRPVLNIVGICMGTCVTCGGPCDKKPGRPHEHKCRLHNVTIAYPE